MAKSKSTTLRFTSVKKRTSIGDSRRSKPLNKSKRMSTKTYRGQGK